MSFLLAVVNFSLFQHSTIIITATTKQSIYGVENFEFGNFRVWLNISIKESIELWEKKIIGPFIFLKAFFFPICMYSPFKCLYYSCLVSTSRFSFHFQCIFFSFILFLVVQTTSNIFLVLQFNNNIKQFFSFFYNIKQFLFFYIINRIFIEK